MFTKFIRKMFTPKTPEFQDIYYISNNEAYEYKVVVSKEVFQKIYEAYKQHIPNLTGSSLVGEYSRNGYICFVTDIVPIGLDSFYDKETRVFTRGIEASKKYFDNLPDKNSHYIGEWKSFCLGEIVDKPETTKVLKDISHDLSMDNLIFISITGFSDDLKINVWVFTGDKLIKLISAYDYKKRVIADYDAKLKHILKTIKEK